jgi:hypothetical protein
VHATVDFAPKQAGGLQDAQVLGDGRERNVEGRGEFGYGGVALRKARENGTARGVRKGAEGGVQGRGGTRIVNHMV